VPICLRYDTIKIQIAVKSAELISIEIMSIEIIIMLINRRHDGKSRKET